MHIYLKLTNFIFNTGGYHSLAPCAGGGRSETLVAEYERAVITPYTLWVQKYHLLAHSVDRYFSFALWVEEELVLFHGISMLHCRPYIKQLHLFAEIETGPINGKMMGKYFFCMR